MKRDPCGELNGKNRKTRFGFRVQRPEVPKRQPQRYLADRKKLAVDTFLSLSFLLPFRSRVCPFISVTSDVSRGSTCCIIHETRPFEAWRVLSIPSRTTYFRSAPVLPSPPRHRFVQLTAAILMINGFRGDIRRLPTPLPWNFIRGISVSMNLINFPSQV